ncbi:serine/threonine-protein kinase [Amycolatopsis sp. NPDC059021]|uniref:serine/threonine-protein kinase n=1 Tax=Amycolatopsis sp. NPDC059021 TaxID=3346704 RepID=UPI00366DF1A3
MEFLVQAAPQPAEKRNRGLVKSVLQTRAKVRLESMAPFRNSTVDGSVRPASPSWLRRLGGRFLPDRHAHHHPSIIPAVFEGQVLAGRYELVERIGAGGMGEVWCATDKELRRAVAVKRATTGDTDQLRREARIGAGMQHPNVVTVFDVIPDGNDRLLVMEYFPAPNLAEILNNEGTLPPRRAAEIGAQIASALAAMHAKGIVHRDITPGNVLVAGNGTAKLTDLGIAIWRDLTLTGIDRVGGTRGFVAPEVTKGRVATSASDIFALGATLFATVEGTPYQPPGTPRRAGRLAPVLSAMLEQDPAKRPTAEQARRMLHRTSGRPRRITALGAAVTVAVAMLGATVWQLWPASSGSPEHPVQALAPPNFRSVMGDPRTADPCALTDPGTLARFGQPQLDSDYDNGYLNQCDVLVRLSEDKKDEADVRIALEPPEPNTPAAPSSEPPPVRFEPQDLNQGECRRTIRLSDTFRVVITAKHNDDRPADLCAMTDALTAGATRVLERGEVPRRAHPIDAASVFRLSTCALLDGSETAAAIDGATPPEQGFGDWKCRWGSKTDGRSASISFGRSRPLYSRDGDQIRLRGRETWVQADGHGAGTCVAQIVYRSITDLKDRSELEVVIVEVRGGAGEQLCQPATRLADAAAARLPR